MKKITKIIKSGFKHWVGDGFHVEQMYNYNSFPHESSPFLLMDYAAPEFFPPSTKQKGVGEHPHRGFETVTIVYSGEVEHRDSTGSGGKIGPGDVQWMTAGSGIVHEEFHGKEFSKSGGEFEVVQLWVDLPKKFKMTPPRYQGITDSQIPKVQIQNSKVRVIAGEFQGTRGSAQTFSPVNLWDMKLKSNDHINLVVPENHNSSLLVLSGKILINSSQELKASQLAFFASEGTQISIEVLEDSKVLFLGGENLNQEVVGHGPFVMNTRAEIVQAISDYQAGKMGHLQ